MPIKNLVETITTRTNQRFDSEVASETTNYLMSLTGESISEYGVVRLRRKGAENGGFRTILLAYLHSSEELSNAIRWSAEVRDALDEPETADLYLFLIIDEISLEDCLRIEANERFCRRFVQRPGETFDSMLDRTFLSSLVTRFSQDTNQEPLSIALAGLKSNHPWFNEEIQKAWRNLLLSGLSGSELAEELLKIVPTLAKELS